jgi:hypothetical protein
MHTHYPIIRGPINYNDSDSRWWLDEEFDMPAVVTRDANGSHIFLDGGTDDIGHRPVIAEINHFNAMPDEFQIDRVDRAIVAITNRDGGENSNGQRHFFLELTTIWNSGKQEN